jgi:hypothetical protein
MLRHQYKLARMRSNEFLCQDITRIPNFANKNSNFSDFPEIGIKMTRISGIRSRIGIPLPMGVPEIGTKNGIPSQILNNLMNTMMYN